MISRVIESALRAMGAEIRDEWCAFGRFSGGGG